MIVRKNPIRSRSSSYGDELREMLHDMSARLTNTAERLSHGSRDVGLRARAGIEDASDTLSDSLAEGWEYVRRRPRSSALVAAAGIGLLAGFLLLRRNSRY